MPNGLITNELLKWEKPTRRVKELLLVKPPHGQSDRFVLKAIAATGTKYGGREKMDKMEAELRALPGGTEGVSRLTAKLDAATLDRTERLLLSTEGVYASIVEDLLVKPTAEAKARAQAKAKAKPGDPDPGDAQKPITEPGETLALFNAVRRELKGPRSFYTKELLKGALKLRGVAYKAAVHDKPLADLQNRELPWMADACAEAIFAVVDTYRTKGSIQDAIDEYRKRKELDPTRLTDAVRAQMIAYLDDMGVALVDDNGAVRATEISHGDFDEYFAIAYQQARSTGKGGTSDPIDAVHLKGVVPDWNFKIDSFDTTEEQGVVPTNILAAGALDYVHNLGERLGLFRLADMVVLKWGSGVIDLDPGDTSAKLYRYWKLRSERTSPEERAMLYKRVFDRGDATLLDGMVANEGFPSLWGNLMTAVTDYIARVEEKKTEENAVSRQRIYQATRQLQYNLTAFTTGMAQMQVNEMWHHLTEAREILEDPQILDFFGSGRRKTIWTVIERGSKEWFGETPNIAAVRDAALHGNKVFQWIAGYDPATVTEQDFQEFKDAAEAWILAQAAEGPEPAATAPEEEPGAVPAEDSHDEFADWDK